MSEGEAPAEKAGLMHNPIVRALILGAIVISVTTAYKAYEDAQKLDPEAERGAVDTLLETRHKALADWIAAQPDPAAARAALPEVSTWLPAHLPCGVARGERSALGEQWSMLWVSTDDEDVPPGKMRYQLRFARDDEAITWVARRDGDCDGLYEIRTLRLEEGWSGVISASGVSVQNLGE